MKRRSPYPYWFVLPAAAIYAVLYLLPTVASFWFSLTRWDLVTTTFIGLENYRQFFSEPFLLQGVGNTLI
jgi:raffinose/stachyose/melibiose transport system permease protein